jgi:hypothetical protein
MAALAELQAMTSALTRGVAEVDDRLVRELVDHRPRDGEAAETRVEDADGRIESGHRRTG